ncbi:transcriptional regulator [Mesorhizobium sp. Root157]|nr:transcriptional regulator [Mesorhizobium sp. Root157]
MFGVVALPTHTSDRNDEASRAARGATGPLVVDMSKILIVGKSRINQVVVSKIIERLGLKPTSETPETAAKVLLALVPGAIVLDGGPDNKDCEALMPAIAALRQASGQSRPSVILLSNRNGTPENLSLSGLIDVVVAKPITSDRLQPVLNRLIVYGHA